VANSPTHVIKADEAKQKLSTGFDKTPGIEPNRYGHHVAAWAGPAEKLPNFARNMLILMGAGAKIQAMGREIFLNRREKIISGIKTHDLIVVFGGRGHNGHSMSVCASAQMGGRRRPYRFANGTAGASAGSLLCPCSTESPGNR
jgi:hypothetical protein